MDNKPLLQHEADRSVRRIKSILLETPDISYAEMAEILTMEGYVSIKGLPFTTVNLRQIIFKLRRDLKTYYGISSRRCGFQPEVMA